MMFCYSLLGLQKNSAERTKRRAQPLARRRTVVRRGVRFVRSIKRTQFRNFLITMKISTLNMTKLITKMAYSLCFISFMRSVHFATAPII